VGATLYGLDLTNVQLQAAVLEKGDLRLAKLVGGDLRGVNLRLAKLNNADLRKANLRPLYFDEKRSMQSDLSGARLRYAD
ncbi:pentapeptide repeat-containing protein, partial [Burkholderia sp. SIMBA_057]